MEEFYIKDDGVRLHAKLERPEGTDRSPLAIVFHGLTGHMEEEHIVAVSETLRSCGFATLRVELYGHGASDGDFERHTLLKWVSGALATTDYAKSLPWVTGLVACGHSQGGLLTMLICGLRADDFLAAIPLSPALVIPAGARSGRMLDFAFDPDHIPDVVEGGGRTLSGDYFRIAATIDVDTYVRAFKRPVLIVHGTRDAAVDVSYSKDVAPRYENCRLHLVEGADHNYHGQLDEVCDAVATFVRELG